LQFRRPGITLIMTRNDYDGETPEKHDVSLFIANAKGDAR